MRGGADAFDQLFPLVYDELRRLAAQQLHRERGPRTVQTTVLVHEAYLKLVQHDGVRCENRAHFFGIAARVMRCLLIDQARARAAAKRGGGAGPTDSGTAPAVPDNLDLIARDQAPETQIIARPQT